MKTRRLSDFVMSVYIFLPLVVTLSACDPALYKQPSADFRSASETLRDTYFLEWDMSNKARIERGDLDDQIQIWASSNVSKEMLDRISARMAQRRQDDIHEQLRPLREQAFAALNGYAATLVGLASGEPTERVQSNLEGLVDDINGTLAAAKKLDLVADAADKLNSYSGPLRQYVGVLNEVIGLVSNTYRERAIIDTIEKSNEAVIELLGILQEEAVFAQSNALNQIDSAKKSIDSFKSHPRFNIASNDTKAFVVKQSAVLEVLDKQVADLDIDAVFAAAKNAQGALMEKATLEEPGDWVERIKAFKEKVSDAKAKIERVSLEM